MKAGNIGGFLLPYWKIFCNVKNSCGKIQNFIKSTKTNSPTGDSEATYLPPVSYALMYIETSSKNQGNNVFVSFERTDFIKNTNKIFYYKSCSILAIDSHKSMGRFRIQLLIEDNTWSI